LGVVDLHLDLLDAALGIVLVDGELRTVGDVDTQLRAVTGFGCRERQREATAAVTSSTATTVIVLSLLLPQAAPAATVPTIISTPTERDSFVVTSLAR